MNQASSQKNTPPPDQPHDSGTPPGKFPVVGIGASAGGLAAFEDFFASIPSDHPDMAFVVVQHLAPDHKSILPELLQHYTRMPVLEARHDMEISINHVYVIPPNCDLAISQGRLQLLPPGELHGFRLPIDYFFKSLAHYYKKYAVGVILSGSGHDGAIGIRSIKEHGGLVLVQNMATAEFNGMPLSAINSGFTDFQLAVTEIPAQIINYFHHTIHNHSPGSVKDRLGDEAIFKAIFILLRSHTTHDFTDYKATTTHRRIRRRMGLHLIDHLSDYFKLLQDSPTELDALFRDLLIGVTHFFRDEEAFQALEQEIIPKFFARQPAGTAIRVWSIGCSTGEEAYSLAMLMQEQMDAIKQSYKVQIFATDMDSRAIASARCGIYPVSISGDMSAERLQRFFTLDTNGASYRVNKNIRDMLIFSEHDIIKDTPFSRLDFICCRNLMIYLNRSLQKKLIPLFHYSLKPEGILFLGLSESIDEFDDLFTVLDRRAKIYQQKNNSQNNHLTATSNFIKFSSPSNPGIMQPISSSTISSKQTLRDLTEQTLLRQVAPASALVNAQGNILYLTGRTGMFLELTPGESGINNILKMAREGLRPALSMLLHKVVESNQIECSLNVKIKTNSHFTSANVTVYPATTEHLNLAETIETPLFLVVFDHIAEPAITTETPDSTSSQSSVEEHLRMLQQQLDEKDEYIMLTQEKLESSNEELKCANEEMQSINEELQSTNEEMETSKEELQSVNEELATVNAELQSKVADLTHANNDMNNMLAGTGIATLFVDHQMRILSFSPGATKIINLIHSDLGRSISHIVTNLVNYDRLVEDIQSVLDTLAPCEVDVSGKEGHWYKLRIQPYRTLTNMIEGAVITFADITALKLSEKN